MVATNLPLFSNLTSSKVKVPNTHGRCPTPLPCHKPVYASVDYCFLECSVAWFVRDFNDFTRSLLPPSSVCPKLQKANISGTCANFCLATRCHIPESAFLRSRQRSCSNATVTSHPVTFVSFIYHHPVVSVTCISATGSLQHITMTYHVLIIFINTCFGRCIRPSAGSRWNS